jgi:hypothetical protein
MKRDEIMVVLADAIPGLVPVRSGPAPQLWKFTPVAGHRARAGVRVGARWISIEAARPRDRDMDPVRMLLMQSALSGGIKVVQRRRGFGLRADIPLLVEMAPARDWLRRQAALVCAGLGTAMGRTNGVPELPVGEGIEFNLAVLAERCTAGGWRASVRSDAEVRVELDSRSAYRVISLSRQGSAIRAAVPLETGALGEQGPETHLALAVFLLRASRSLRWVRAFATGTDGTLEAAGFECILAPPGDDQPVVMALDALATACELFGCEAETLAASALLAEHYLALDEDGPGRPATPTDRIPADSALEPGAVTAGAIA